MRIFLVGFMGAGKSYTGKRLASLVGKPFIDLDEWIVARSGQSISELFSKAGEQAFRELERDTLRNLEPLPSFVLACGGGTPCFFDNMEWMCKYGKTVFLDVHEAVLLQRLEREAAHRPLLASEENISASIRKKLAIRRKDYEKAQIHVRSDNPDADLARLVYNKIVQP